MDSASILEDRQPCKLSSCNESKEHIFQLYYMLELWYPPQEMIDWRGLVGRSNKSIPNQMNKEDAHTRTPIAVVRTVLTS